MKQSWKNWSAQINVPTLAAPLFVFLSTDGDDVILSAQGFGADGEPFQRVASWVDNLEKRGSAETRLQSADELGADLVANWTWPGAGRKAQALVKLQAPSVSLRYPNPKSPRLDLEISVRLVELTRPRPKSRPQVDRIVDELASLGDFAKVSGTLIVASKLSRGVALEDVRDNLPSNWTASRVGSEIHVSDSDWDE
jgi:hypothetical protein